MAPGAGRDGPTGAGGGSCARCGTTSDEVTLDWSLQRDDRGTRRLCPACTREHVRDIECRLPDAWW